MRLLALALLGGCGRIAFDPHGIGDGGGNIGDGDAMGDPVPIPGLIAWHPLDSYSAGPMTTIDATGHGHNGQCAGDICPMFGVAGKRDGAGRFDGLDDQITVSSAPDLQLTSGFTVSFWINMTAAPAIRSCAVQQRLGAIDFDSWQLCVEPDASLFYFTADGTTASFFNTVAKFPFNGWHHIALLWDGSVKTIVLDGTVIGSAPAAIAFDDQPIYFGLDYDGGTAVSKFAGDLDDVRIYNRPLTPAELAALIQ